MSSQQQDGAGWKEQLKAIGNLIVESQGMDEGGDEMRAYQSYLSSVQYISKALAADIMTNQTRGSLPVPQATKLFKLAHHCLERAEEMYETAQGEGRGLAGEGGRVSQDTLPQQQDTAQMNHHQQQQQQQLPFRTRVHTSPSSSPAFASTSTHPTHTVPTSTRTLSDSTHTLPIPTHTLPIPPSVARAISVPSSNTAIPSNKTARSFHSVGTSYMREARLRNHYMMEQYKAHLRHTSSQMLPHSQEMGLSMLRRLEENVSVARIRQQNVARKARERELRQQAELKTSSKRQQVVSLNQLSVEELKEQVASFEHGKSILHALSTLKTKIASIGPNASTTVPGSSTSSTSSTSNQVFNLVNEILNNHDHPLSRLLGECQLEIFSLLKPLHSAVERTGGLPAIDIRLKDREKTVPPSCSVRFRSASSPEPITSHSPTPHTTSHPHPPPITTVPEGDSEGHTERDDSHLDLFFLNDREDDDDDYLFTLSIDAINSEKVSQHCRPKGTGSNFDVPLAGTIFGSPEGDTSAGVRDVEEREGGGGGRGGGGGGGGGVLDEKLMRLRAELLQEGARSSSVGQAGCREYEEAKEKCRRIERGNHEGGREEREGERKDAEEGERAEEDCKLVDSELESSAVLVPGHPPTSAAFPVTSNQGQDCNGASSPTRSDVSQLYTSSDKLASYLQSRKEAGAHRDSHPVGEAEGEGAAHYRAEDGSALVNVVVSADLPDGGMFSRLPPPSPLSTEQKEGEEEEEEEEEVVFSSLPPLACQLHVGSEEKMSALRESAVSTLEHVVPLIHASMDKLEQVFVACYPSLSGRQEREECRSILESLLFPALSCPLLSAYRCKHYQEEVSTVRNMCRSCNATPKDLDVRRKFWLLEQAHAPYGEAIDELRRVPSLPYPTLKLDCLVRSSRQVVQCIDEYYEAQGQSRGSVDSGVGVDDILPILSYVIIRSGLPQLVAEMAIMDEFMQDGYAKGEEGFCLTSFMTALKFVSQMSS